MSETAQVVGAEPDTVGEASFSVSFPAGMEIEAGKTYWLQMEESLSEASFAHIRKEIMRYLKACLDPLPRLIFFRGPLPSEQALSPWGSAVKRAEQVAAALWENDRTVLLAQERPFIITREEVANITEELGSMPDRLSTLYGEWPLVPLAEGGALATIRVAVVEPYEQRAP